VSKAAAHLILWITAAFLGVFLVWPVFESITGAFIDATGQPSLAYLAEVFRNSIYLDGLRNALLMGIGSTALAMMIALPLAWLADR
jgi:iron(III) transport system permease protein